MTRKFTFLLMALLALAGFKSWGQETLTVCDGTTTNYQIPVNTFYFDTPNSFSQFIIPSAEDGMEALSGKSITQLQFHISSQGNLVYQIANTEINCSLKEVESETMTGSISSGLTEVFSGKPNYTESVMTIPFDTPYNYEGGNLLISITVTVGSGSPSIGFKGKSVNYNAAYCYDYQDNFHQFLPKTTITYAVAVSCPAPTGLAASNVTATGATISWTGSAESYDLAYGVASTFNLENPLTYTLQNTTTTSVQLSGLTAETEYKCAVKAHCSDEDESAWSDAISFLPTDKIIVDFESGIPSDWTLIDNDGDGHNWFISQTYHHSGNNCLQSESYSETTWQNYNADNFFVSPQITLGENASMSFFARSWNNSWKDRVRVQISTTDNNANSFTTTLYDGKPSNNWTEIQIDLSEYEGQNVYIAFRHTDKGQESSFIDDITIDPGETVEKFAITLTQPEDAAVGTISADYEQAAAGTTVTLSANFNLGYTLNYFMVDEEPIEGNTFEMPEHDVTVSVTYNTLDMYAITFDPEIDDDIISVSATYNDEPITAAPAGTVIMLSYSNLDEGYIFNCWTLNGAQLPGSTFEMPEEDAEIGVNLTERERYAVTIDFDVQDYITANPSSDILGGTTVTLTISPATGYVLAELHVLDEGQNEQDVTINPENSNIRTFIMPESNVTVSAVFSPVYNISIDMALVGGSISQMSTQGTLTAYPAGTQVFLFANPDEDYSFVENSFIVIRSDGEIGPTVTYTNMVYSFIMPESNVTVSATFNKTAFAVSQVITPTYSGSFSVSKTAHVETGETVTLSNFNAGNGYYFDFEDVNSLVVKRNDTQANVEVTLYYNSFYQFVMPASDVTVTATFKVRPRYEVVIGTVTNGTVTFSYGEPDDHKYMSGEPVYLEVYPASSGYTLESITATPSEGSAITPQPYYGGPTYYFTMPDFESEESTVTVTATFRELNTYTINYYVNGELDRTMDCKEDRFVNNDGPQNVAVPAGTSFEGWGVAEIGTYTTEKPAVLGNAEHPTQNYDLYAVLSYTESVPASSKSGETWKKVTSTSELSAGDEIVLVYSNLVMCTRENAGWEDYPVADVTISNGEITYLPENAAQFTLIANNGYWNLQYNELGATRILATNSSNNELASKDLYELWYPTYMSIDFTATTNGNSVLFYNSDTYMYIRYRSDWSQITTSNGSSATYACQAYKKDNPMVTTNYYMTSVLTEGTVADATFKNIIVVNPITVSGRLEMNAGGLFRNENTANFVFADGAQFYYTGEETVKATFEKEIKAYQEATGNDGYYLIANPTNETAVANLNSNNYDLYTFDPAGDGNGNEWINMKNLSMDVENGIGYLYANNTKTTLEFAGVLNPAGSTDVNLIYAEEVEGIDFPGFNLVGNPFACNAYVSGYNFYTMENGEFILNEGSATIAPCEGFFVEATAADQSVTLSTTVPAPTSLLSLTVSQNRGNVIDRAIVRFDGANDLHKFMLNPDHTNIRLAKHGEEFAAISSEAEGEIPVSFKAEKNGSYTITVNTENVNAHYIHLIDNKTGMDVDLLATPSYTFNASTSDYAYRFKLVFSMTGVEENGSNANSYAYINNGNLVIDHIEGEATMQIVDMLGRVVSTEIVSGSYNKALNLKAGLYIINLNGMTQKIVVK